VIPFENQEAWEQQASLYRVTEAEAEGEDV